MKKLFISMIQVTRSRVFRRILAGYLLLIIAVAAAGGFSFFLANKISRENIVTRSELILKNAGYQINGALRLAESHNNTLYYRNDLQVLMGRARDKETLASIYELINRLPAIYDSTQIITGYYIYLPSLDYIVAPSSGISHVELYYRPYLAISQAETYDEWREAVLEGERSKMHASYQEGSDILYSTSIPSSTLGMKPCRVVYTLSSESIIKLITQAFSNDSTNEQFVCVTDSDGFILCADAGYSDETISKGFTHISCELTVKGMKAHIYISNRYIAKDAANAVKPLFIILIWMLALALLLIIFVAVSNFKPLIDVAERAEKISGRSHGLGMISEAFSLVDRNQQELQRALQLQSDYLRNACINRLIRGSGHDALQLEEMLAAAHINLSGDAFRATIIVFEHLTAGASAQALGLEVLGSFSPRLSVLSLEDTETVFALYCMKESETDVERAFFTELYNALKDKANIESKFYLGGTCSNPDEVSDSFAQAAYIRSSLSEGTWLNVYSPIGADADLGCILGDSEQTHFKESILSGDVESVQQQLDYFENHYFIESRSHGFKRQYVFCRLVEALIACGQNLETKTALPDDIMNMKSKDFFAWLAGPCLVLCEKAHDRLKQRNRQLIDEAISFIDSHYSEYDLTLATLSDRLNLTSAYLSSLFKKQLGTNFSVYLEQLRITRAVELLSLGKMSIEEVAQNVGYGNADSFRRAFKRVKGISPSKYSKSTPTSIIP